MLYQKISAVLFVGLLLISAMACEREGPAERAGERVDRTVEEAGERVERTTK